MCSTFRGKANPFIILEIKEKRKKKQKDRERQRQRQNKHTHTKDCYASQYLPNISRSSAIPANLSVSYTNLHNIHT